MYYELIKHEENMKYMSEFMNSFNDFRRGGLSNPDSIFYMGEDNSPQPMFRGVADIIHKAGGLVFLAHPFEYKFEDTIGFIDDLRKRKEAGTKVLASQLFLDCRARRSG